MPQYAYDYSGVLPANLIQNELRTINTVAGSPGYGFLVIPDAAPFYSNSLVVVHNDAVTGNTILQQGIDYQLCYPWQQAKNVSGFDVHGGFILTNPNFLGTLEYRYQTIGGTYVQNRPAGRTEGFYALSQPILIDWDTAPASFPSTPHTHPLEELNGMAQIYAKLDALKEAIEAQPYKFRLEDMADVDTQFIGPMLLALSGIEAQLENNNWLISTLNNLQLKMGELFHYATTPNGATTNVSFQIGGKLHCKILRYSVANGTDLPSNITFPAAFPTKCLFSHCSLTRDTYVGGGGFSTMNGTARHTTATTTGIANILYNFDYNATAVPQTLTVIAVGF